MFKNRIAVYAFMGAVCAMFLAQPAFADTAKRIDVVATGEIKELSIGSASNRTNTKININVKNGQVINAGDYVDISLNNLFDYGLLNRDIRYKDTIIGKINFIKAEDNLDGFKRRAIKGHPEAEDIIPEKTAGRNSEYKLIFNEQAKKFTNMDLSIELVDNNYSAYANHKYNIEHSFQVNDKEIAHKTGTINGFDKMPSNFYLGLNNILADSKDGENVIGNLFDFRLYQSDKNNPKHAKPGDIVKMKLPESSGVAFNTSSNPKEGTVTSPRLAILDTSEKTVNYSEGKLNPISATTEIYRGDDKYFSLERSTGGAINGTKMKSYADIKKRGSVIVRYQDENGVSLAPEVLLANKVQVGTDYSAEEKQFEGFEKAELFKNSSPKTGKVEEGVKIVTFVYKKKSIPAPEKPLNPVKEEKKPKENISAPNTGFENNFIKNLLFMGGAALSVISIIVIRKNY